MYSDGKLNRASVYLFQDENSTSRKSSRSSHFFTMNDIESQMITTATLSQAPMASTETLESSAPIRFLIDKKDNLMINFFNVTLSIY